MTSFTCSSESEGWASELFIIHRVREGEEQEEEEGE